MYYENQMAIHDIKHLETRTIDDNPYDIDDQRELWFWWNMGVLGVFLMEES